jgi:cholesterol transport system auxiliary component
MKTSVTWMFLCVGMVLTGFGCYQQADDAQYFLLDVQRSGSPQTQPKDIILTVRPFSLSPGNHPNELTYRKKDFQYKSDYYNRFITDAGRQVAEQTRRWLADSGMFAQVVPPGSTMSATHMLEGNITRLYIDKRDKTNIQAVMSVTFYYLDISGRKPEVLYSETCDAFSAVSENKAENFIEAYNVGLKQILLNLEATFQKELK